MSCFFRISVLGGVEKDCRQTGDPCLLGWHCFVREPGRLGQAKDPDLPLADTESGPRVESFAQVNALAEDLTAPP